MLRNTTGSSNTAIGFAALQLGTTGSHNTALGNFTLNDVSTGSGNIAVGSEAGEKSNHWEQQHRDWQPGGRGRHEHYPHRHEGHTDPRSHRWHLHLTGLWLTGIHQCEWPAWRRGGSGAHKRDIHDMGDASARLLQLRPVSFRYRQDPKGTLQYGLIAEEVERVYPQGVATMTAR